MSMVQALLDKQDKLAVVGLGYVGMPLALAFSEHMDVIGYDINKKRVQEYIAHIDGTNEVGSEALRKTTCRFTSEADELAAVKFFIIAVPTPIDKDNLPDLAALEGASETVGRVLTKGAYVVYESTVYPGVTEDVCIPLLEKYSDLKCPEDFKVGYSPERINPGDKHNRIDSIVKIVSGIDDEALEQIGDVYRVIVKAGIYPAESIKVAEAAKVAENSQRDINIAFMNELARSFDSMGIDTTSVINAMNTKWNALNFHPGLVGGHCISVDPYYLIYKSQLTNNRLEFLSISRRINEEMPDYIVQKAIRLMIEEEILIKNANIAVLGITYKENCPDLRNTKVINIIDQLRSYGAHVCIYDPVANPQEVLDEFGIGMEDDYTKLSDMDVIIMAVAHDAFEEMVSITDKLVNTIVLDVQGKFSDIFVKNKSLRYWRL